MFPLLNLTEDLVALSKARLYPKRSCLFYVCIFKHYVGTCYYLFTIFVAPELAIINFCSVIFKFLVSPSYQDGAGGHHT